MTEFGGRDKIDVTSHLFWELRCQNSRVLVGFVQWSCDFVRLGERGGELWLLGNVGKGFEGPKVDGEV